MYFKNNNIYDQYKDTFLNISSKLAKLQGCLGVVLGGGVARGWYDGVNNQDVDYYLYFHSEQYTQYLDNEGFNEEWPWVIDVNYLNLKLSIQFLDYDALWTACPEPIIWSADDHRWTQSNRWDKLNSQIIIDKNNRIHRLFEKKVRYPNSEQRILNKYFENKIMNFYWGDLLSHELRGLFPEANLNLSKCVDIFINWIYTKNYLFIPPDKWKFWWLRNSTAGLNISFYEILDLYNVTDIKSQKEFRHRKDKINQIFSNHCFDLTKPNINKSEKIPEWLTPYFFSSENQ